jgi:hypothetical protein
MVAICLAAHSSRAIAQSSGITWSTPENISSTPQSSTNAAIVADVYGRVHVFWSEEVDGPPMQPREAPHSGNTIYHKVWDGTSWTKANDVLFVPDDPIAEFVSATTGPDNMLHVVWTGQSNIYYSNAPAFQATSAQAWAKPEIVAADSARSAWESSVAIDSVGNVHIAYATRGTDAGVYHILSTDGGVTWGSPIKLSEPFDLLETDFSRVKMITDNGGGLHVVWETTERQGYGQAIYYARSIDGGLTWSNALQLGYRQPKDFDVGWPYITAVGESELRLIYNAELAVGRYERISTDGGESWSEPRHILTEMAGINGYNVPVVDGGGHLHIIVNMRTRDTQAVGIYYADWLDTGWSSAVPVFNDPTNIGAATAHYAAATVRLGNDIHIVWTQNEGGEIWHVHGTVQGLQPANAQDFPTPTVGAPSTPEPVLTMMPLTKAVPTLEPADAPRPQMTGSTEFSPLIAGVMATLILVASVFLWTRTRRD